MINVKQKIRCEHEETGWCGQSLSNPEGFDSHWPCSRLEATAAAREDVTPEREFLTSR